MILSSRIKFLHFLWGVCWIHNPQTGLPLGVYTAFFSPSDTSLCPLVSFNTQPPDEKGNSKAVGHLLHPAKLDKVIDLLLVNRAELVWLMVLSAWSCITTEVQSSLTQSAHHTLSVCLLQHVWIESIIALLHTQTHTHLMLYQSPGNLIIKPPISSPPPLPKSCLPVTQQSSNTYIDKHTHKHKILFTSGVESSALEVDVRPSRGMWHRGLREARGWLRTRDAWTRECFCRFRIKNQAEILLA